VIFSIRILLVFTFCLGTSSTFSKDIRTGNLGSLHDHELAAYGEIRGLEGLTPEKFRQCSPQESIPFPKEIPADWLESIFIPREMRDLKSCKPDSCAFNFTPEEREQIGKLSSNEEIQQKFFEFYQARVAKPGELHPLIQRFKITDAKASFSEACQSPELKTLITERPLKNWPFRFSSVRYESQMRPTTRLTQGKHFKANQTHCFAEALIFSNHYDAELIKVWAFDPSTTSVRVEIRHRIDFLSTWFRRLQKPKLQAALERVLGEELAAFQACVK
jgi:hypothetical protein